MRQICRSNRIPLQTELHETIHALQTINIRYLISVGFEFP